MWSPSFTFELNCHTNLNFVKTCSGLRTSIRLKIKKNTWTIIRMMKDETNKKMKMPTRNDKMTINNNARVLKRHVRNNVCTMLDMNFSFWTIGTLRCWGFKALDMMLKITKNKIKDVVDHGSLKSMIRRIVGDVGKKERNFWSNEGCQKRHDGC